MFSRNMVLALLFSIYSFQPRASDEEFACSDFLAAFRHEAPALRDEKGEKIVIDEGDWKEFLNRKIVLSDGTVLQYRDLDTLSASFWSMHRADWEAVAKAVSIEMRRELEARGVNVWGRAYDVLNPLARYDLPLHGWGTHPLNKLSENLAKEGRPLAIHSPQDQMGIVPMDKMATPFGLMPRNTLPKSSLPLAFLPMQETHIPAYLRELSRVLEPTDDAVIALSFLGNQNGRQVIEGTPIEMFTGSYRNEWHGRQSRRGNRAFRMPPDEVSLLSHEGTTSETLRVLKTEEFRLAEVIGALFQKIVKEPENHAAQKKFSTEMLEYLNQTGVPAYSKKQGNKTITVIKPLSEAEWRQHYGEITAGMDVPGIEELPALTQIATKLKSRGFELIIDVSEDSLAGSLVDVEKGQLHLSLGSAFMKTPLESFWLKPGAELKLPNRDECFVSNATMDIEKIPSSPHRLENLLSSANELAKAIREHQSKKMFMDPNLYAQQLAGLSRNFEYFRLNAQSEAKLLKVFKDKSISDKSPIQIHISQDSEGVQSVMVKSNEGPLAMFRVVTPKGSSDAQVRGAVHEFINHTEAQLDTAEKTLQDLRAFSQLLSENTINRLDSDQIVRIANNDHDDLKKLHERMAKSNVVDYFAIHREDLMGQKGLSDLASKRISSLEDEAGESPQTLLALRAAHRDYFLMKDSSFSKNDGISSYAADNFYKIISAAAESKSKDVREEAYNFAVDLACNSQSRTIRMYMAGVFKKLGIKSDKVKNILIEGLHEIKTDSESKGVSNWSALAIAKLYPEIAIREFPEYIRHFPKSDPRTVILGAILDEKVFHPELMKAAIDAMGSMPTSGSPGYSGYLKGFVPENPDLLKALEDKVVNMVAASTPEKVANLWEVAQIVRAWKLVGPRIQESYRNYLRNVNPEFSGSDVAFQLFEMDPADPTAISWYQRELGSPIENQLWSQSAGDMVIVSNTVSHPWNYLALIEEFSQFHPKSSVILGAVKRLENTFSTSNTQYAGFNFKLLNEVRARAGLPPMTPPNWANK